MPMDGLSAAPEASRWRRALGDVLSRGSLGPPRAGASGRRRWLGAAPRRRRPKAPTGGTGGQAEVKRLEATVYIYIYVIATQMYVYSLIRMAFS